MSTISAVIIFAVCVVVIDQINSLPTNANFNANYKRAKSFKCEHPQPRAVTVTDEIKTGIQGKKINPPQTVLYKCNSGSGCCLNDEKVCGPMEIKPVEITFYVKYQVDTDTHKVGDTAYESFTFQNHTRCGCIDPSSQ